MRKKTIRNVFSIHCESSVSLFTIFTGRYSFYLGENTDKSLRTIESRSLSYLNDFVVRTVKLLTGVFDAESVDIVVEGTLSFFVEVCTDIGAIGAYGCSYV